MIETSVRQKVVDSLFLARNRFLGGKGAQFAVDVLKSNRLMTEFFWKMNPFHSTEDACNLVDAVLEQPSIRRLDLAGSLNENITPYTPVKRLFGGLGTETLLIVSLSFNGIKTNGYRCISDFLATNPPLIRLYLGGNRLNDNDALRIALALQFNTNLIYLGLNDNALTEEGKRVAYHQAIFCPVLSNMLVFLTWNVNNLN